MEPTQIRGRLFTLRGFILATIIGNILGAAILISYNFHCLRKTKLTLLTWLVAIGMTITNYFLMVSIDYGMSLVMIFVTLFLGLWVINKFQQPYIDLTIDAGKKTVPAWFGALIGLCCMMLPLALMKLAN